MKWNEMKSMFLFQKTTQQTLQKHCQFCLDAMNFRVPRTERSCWRRQTFSEWTGKMSDKFQSMDLQSVPGAVKVEDLWWYFDWQSNSSDEDTAEESCLYKCPCWAIVLIHTWRSFCTSDHRMRWIPWTQLFVSYFWQSSGRGPRGDHHLRSHL